MTNMKNQPECIKMDMIRCSSTDQKIRAIKKCGLFNSLLAYLKKKKFHRILEELTDLYIDDMLPRTDYDTSYITPYTSEVADTYGLTYRINASFVKTKFHIYIACQKPKKKYYDKFIEFANICSDLIVCLCNDDDDYFIEENTQQGKSDKNAIYKIENINNTQRIKFLKWNDFSVPDENDFKIFYAKYRFIVKQETPVIVHCRAGVGRTGTFILYDTLARMETVTETVFIEELCRVRAARNYMVYNKEQLSWLANIFLYNKH